MFTLIVFIVILGLLVFVHEFGHFLAARLTGMKVYEFAIGYPPRMFGVYKDPKTKKYVWVWRRGKNSAKPVDDVPDLRQEFPATLYSLHLLPLGGFCNIKGENGESVNDKDSFGHQKPWKRFVVLMAGVTMNFLLTAILFSVGFIVGLPADISNLNDDKIIVVDQPQVIVQMVEKESPAEKGGIKFGDKIVSLYGTEINSSKELIDIIQTYEEGIIDLKVDRSGQIVSLEVVPDIKEDGKKQIGIMMADAAIVRYPWYIAIYKGFVASGIALINIFVAFGILIGNLVVGKGLAFEVSGPVGIAVVLGQSARLGISYLINATAMISLSLAAINILPIPALDCGRILFLGIEKIRGKPINREIEKNINGVFFFLLMILMIFVTAKDIMKLF